jgi:hypothetical protein
VVSGSNNENVATIAMKVNAVDRMVRITFRAVNPGDRGGRDERVSGE